jgi:hypothetical protein
MKARLAMEHWALTYQDPSQADLVKFEKGEFRSVDFKDLQSRLEGVCGIDLSKQRALLKEEEPSDPTSQHNRTTSAAKDQTKA